MAEGTALRNRLRAELDASGLMRETGGVGQLNGGEAGSDGTGGDVFSSLGQGEGNDGSAEGAAPASAGPDQRDQLLVSIARLGCIVRETDSSAALWLATYFRWLRATATLGGGPVGAKRSRPWEMEPVATSSRAALGDGMRPRSGDNCAVVASSAPRGRGTPCGGWARWRCALALLARLPPDEWEAVALELEPASLAVLPPSCQLELLLSMAQLLLHWCRNRDVSISVGELDGAARKKSTARLHDRTSRFVRSFDALAQGLLLAAGRAEPLLLAAVAHFYDIVVVRLYSQHQIPIVVLPPPRLAQRCLLCPYPHVASRMAGVVASYRGEMIALRKRTTPSMATASGLQDIPRLNAIVLDGCNTLWRNRAFEEQQQADSGVSPSHAVDGCSMLSASVVKRLKQSVAHTTATVVSMSAVDTHRLLSLTHGAAWQHFARDFWQVMRQRGVLQPDELRASPQQRVQCIEGKYKTEYLDFLNLQGFVGMHNFLHAFIGSLAKRKI